MNLVNRYRERHYASIITTPWSNSQLFLTIEFYESPRSRDMSEQLWVCPNSRTTPQLKGVWLLALLHCWQVTNKFLKQQTEEWEDRPLSPVWTIDIDDRHTWLLSLLFKKFTKNDTIPWYMLHAQDQTHNIYISWNSIFIPYTIMFNMIIVGFLFFFHFIFNSAGLSPDQRQCLLWAWLEW